MWQNLVVIFAVSVAALYVIWSLAPRVVREWVATRCGGRVPWLARRVDEGGCAECAASNKTRSSR